MKLIEITSLKRPNSTYIEVSYVMRFPFPASLLSGGLPVPNADDILRSYDDYDAEWSVDTVPPTQGFVSVMTNVIYSKTLSISAASLSLAQFKTQLINKYNAMASVIAGMSLKPYDTLIGAYYDGTIWATA